MPGNDVPFFWSSLRAPLLPRADWQNPPGGRICRFHFSGMEPFAEEKTAEDVESLGQHASALGPEQWQPFEAVPPDSDNSPETANMNNMIEAAERTRMISRFVCSVLLCVACFGAIVMILREAIQGATKSFYCSSDGQEPDIASPAPLACAVPLALAAVLCNLSVVVGLLCVSRFAWLSGRSLQCLADGPASMTHLQQLRSKLQKDLNKWRRFSAKAGFGNGFWVRMSPRLLRFLLVYVLVGLTFTALSSGATERVTQRDHFDGAAPSMQPWVEVGRRL
eukprot:Skav227725  [mRNA]  locus=scaffold802:146379:147937:+ [translate_table: standard]